MSEQTAQATSQYAAIVEGITDRHKHKPGPLLPILHEIKEKIGYIPEETAGIIAQGLNLSLAEVHGVISFYHHFNTTPHGEHVVEICRAESCQAMGSQQLEHFAKKKLGVDYHQTTADAQITLEPVYCLGNCACSPSIRIGEHIYGRVDAERFNEIIDDLYTKPVEVK